MSKNKEPKKHKPHVETYPNMQSIVEVSPNVSMGNLMLANSYVLGSQFLSMATNNQLNNQTSMAATAKNVVKILGTTNADMNALTTRIAGGIINNN
ncbi:MAG: hypothetical protein JKY92_09970 [Magnetovibrio sp.]|nr:hypothetical protein [Magnetovibrio sp.]